jgi:hypothetical protein
LYTSYPKAVRWQGYIGKDTLNEKRRQAKFGVSSIDVLVADSITSHRMLHMQLDGLTIFFLMDILQSSKAAATNVRVLSKRVSATSVHFVANQAHGIHCHKVILVNQQPDIFQCYIDIAQDLENRTLVMKARAQARPCAFICVDNGRFDSPQI